MSAGVGMGARPLHGDAVHFLNPEERRNLRRIERNAVLRAGAAGAFAASLGAVVSVLARPLLGDEPDDISWLEYLRYLAVTLLTALPVAIVELSFIYWNAIISVHRLAEAAGVALFRPDDDSDDDSDEIFAAVLARAALEIPNPPRPMFGINPRREASRWRLLLATVVYKAKVSLSNFVLRKLLVRANERKRASAEPAEYRIDLAPGQSATLGTLAVFRGVTSLVAGSRQVNASDVPKSWLDFASTKFGPIPMIVALVVVLVWALDSSRVVVPGARRAQPAPLGIQGVKA